MPDDRAMKIQDRGAVLNDMITYRLSRLQAKLNAQATRILKENGGLTLTQWRILVVLDLRGEVTLARMVRETKFDKGLLSRTIKTMIQKGLVTSKISESDQRQNLLTMTDKGYAKFEKALPLMRGRQRELLHSFSEQQRADLYAALDRIENAARDMDAKP